MVAHIVFALEVSGGDLTDSFHYRKEFVSGKVAFCKSRNDPEMQDG